MDWNKEPVSRHVGFETPENYSDGELQQTVEKSGMEIQIWKSSTILMVFKTWSIRLLFFSHIIIAAVSWWVFFMLFFIYSCYLSLGWYKNLQFWRQESARSRCQQIHHWSCHWCENMDEGFLLSAGGCLLTVSSPGWSKREERGWENERERECAHTLWCLHCFMRALIPFTSFPSSRPGYLQRPYFLIPSH